LNRRLKQLYYGTLITLAGMLILAGLSGYYLLSRLYTVPDWYKNNLTEFALPDTLSPTRSKSSTILSQDFVPPPETVIEQNLKANRRENVPEQPTHPVVQPARETPTVPPAKHNIRREITRRDAKPTIPTISSPKKTQTITEAELPLILVTALEDIWQQDIRHGIRAIRAHIYPDKLQIETVLDVNFFNAIPQIRDHALWKSIRHLGGNELYTKVEIFPDKKQSVNHISPKSYVTFGNLTVTITQLEDFFHLSVEEVIPSLGIKSIKLGSGVLVAD